MFEGFRLFILICVFVLGGLLGGGLVRSCSPRPVAPHSDTTTTIAVKVPPPVHDTLWRDSIKIKRVAVPVMQYIHDTISGKYIPVVAGHDSATCYSVAKDTLGARIVAEICSDSFPRTKPLDLRASIFYQAPPCSSRTITLTNTVVQTKVQPILGDWRFWTGCVVALVGGAYAGHSLK
jgi:hypothetical protein